MIRTIILTIIKTTPKINIIVNQGSFIHFIHLIPILVQYIIIIITPIVNIEIDKICFLALILSKIMINNPINVKMIPNISRTY
jgi:hypothetical protein